jgi:hypothetical protein
MRKYLIIEVATNQIIGAEELCTDRVMEIEGSGFRLVPIAEILPFVTATSALNVLFAVTTLPPLINKSIIFVPPLVKKVIIQRAFEFQRPL